MTMFTLPNFCRVCLKYDKNLIDLAHIENEPNETLMSKLQHCVSEVEWTTFKPLLCHPCIKRLNIAYSFKKQCVQSAGVLKSYIELVKESQKKNESPNSGKNDNPIPATGGAFMLLPNQKYVKILVGPQNQGATANTFQNVFLNLIPTASLNSIPPPPIAPISGTNSKSKDTNQNVFLNINNTFQKFIPLNSSVTPTTPNVPPSITVDVPSKKSSDSGKSKSIPTSINVNHMLTESKSEEVSVEIDPTIFGLEGDDEDSNEEEVNDYDEVISSAKITLKDFKTNGEIQNGKDDSSSKQFVPILPKQDDFIMSGEHFLFSSSENTNSFFCEQCQKSFSNRKLLKVHINQFHLGKMPFKCEYCYTEYATRVEFEACRKNHRLESDALNKTLTLEDFANASNISDSSQIEIEANIEPTENGEYICDVCCRPFNSSTGLLRHKVRKHNQKNKKKYFIKGMKNARCDICNRDFSTQSYMQLHKKLHMRDDIGYKYKVFGKSKYGEIEERDEKREELKEKTKRMLERKGKKMLKELRREKNAQQMENLTPVDKKESDEDKKIVDKAGASDVTEEEPKVAEGVDDDAKLDEDDLVDVKVEEVENENSIMDVDDDNSQSDETSNQGDEHDTDDRMSEEN